MLRVFWEIYLKMFSLRLYLGKTNMGKKHECYVFWSGKKVKNNTKSYLSLLLDWGRRMMGAISIMALPLVISVFKPLSTTTRLHSTLLRRRRFTTLSATTSPSHSLSQHSSTSSSTHSNNSAPHNHSSLTFQQAIQRLQVLNIQQSHFTIFFFL